MLAPSAAHAGLLGVKGNGEKKTESRPTASPFDRIVNKSSLDLMVREDDTYRVAVTIDANLQQYVATRIKDQTLVVEITESIRHQGEAAVLVTLPRLAGLEVSGSGDARVALGKTAHELSVDADGSGDVTVSGDTTKLHVGLTGSGSGMVTGATQDLDAEAAGSGDLSFTGKAQTLHVITSGSGDVKLSGSASKLRADSTGSGDIAAKDLVAREADLQTTGSGDVTATIDGGSLSIRTTGSGDIAWWGRARLERVEVNGSGNLDQHGKTVVD